jgi:predicted RND superfamily exporter protein
MGVVTNTVMGVGGLVIGVIVILVITSTLINANLLTEDSAEDAAVNNLSSNFTDGLNRISEKIPTILLIVAVVFLFGALILLVRNAKIMGIGGGGSL